MYDASSAAALNTDLLPPSCGENKARPLRWHSTGLVVEWGEDMLQVLERGFYEGLSATKIADILNRTCKVRKTRNAVIGKLHRMGLILSDEQRKARRGPEQRVRKPRILPANTRQAPKQKFTDERFQCEPTFVAEPPRDPMLHDGRARVVETLQAGECKFPFGDPREPDFCFCARRSAEESSYCADHMRLTHNPAAPKSLMSLAKAFR